MPGTVFVACKMPNGVILDLDRYEKINDRGDVREVKGGQTVTLKGVAYHIGLDERPELHGGYRLTEIDADFWDAWYALNKDSSSLLKDRLIFAMPRRDHAAAKGREQAAVPQLFPPARGDEVSGVRAVPAEERQPA